MRNKPNFFIVLLFILIGTNFLSFRIFAQSILPIHFTHYTTDDGLPHDIGYQMIDDSQGFLWIGTDNGIARFDGNKFKIFGDASGLTNPYAIDMTTSNDQDFYIGTWGDGIFKKTKDTIIHLPLDLASQKIARVNSLDKDFLEIWTKNGFTKMGYHTYTKKRYDIFKKKVYRVLFYKKDGIYYKSVEEKVEFQEKILKDTSIVKIINQDETRWIISPSIKTSNQEEIYFTKEGIFKTTPQSSSIELTKPYSFYKEFPDNIWKATNTKILEPFDKRLKGISITSLVEDQKGGIWLSSQGNLFYLGSDGILKSYLGSSPNSSPYDLTIWQDKYIAFFNFEDRNQLFLFDIETSQIHRVDSQLGISVSISDLFADKEDNLWMTTDGLGLFCIKPFSTRNYAKEEGLENSFIYDLIETKDGTIYAATKKGLFFNSNERWIKINHPLTNSDLHGGIAINSNGNIVLGTGADFKKILELEIPSHQIKNTKDAYLGRTFYMDQKNKIWSIKVFDLLNKVYKTHRPEKLKSIYKDLDWGKRFSKEFFKKFFKIQEIRNDHFAVLEINKTTSLMGTSRGLFEVVGDSLRHYSKEDGLPSTAVHDIVQSEDGKIWIATEKGVCIKNGNQFLPVSSDGLLSLQARKLLFDHKGQLWVGTPSGLHYFIFSEKTWIPLTKHLGLIANDVTALYEDTKQRLWIGTSRGLSMLPNRKTQKRLAPPPVSIEKIFINNQLYQKTNQKNKVPFKSTLRVEYTALSFQSAKELTFRYRLNVGEKWQTTSSRSIALFDLADGKYHFQIQAKKINSNWSSPEIISFIVKPPWYRSYWFLLLSGFGIYSVVQFLFLYRVRSERAKIEIEVQLKEEMAQIEMKALQAQMNPHFIFNAMNSIMDFVMNEDKYSANRYLAKFSKLMRLFLDASKANFNTLGEELELITLYVELEKLRFKDKFDFKISYDDALSIDLLEIPSILIQPFIENAIHHGLHLKKGKGNLEMRISQNNQVLKIEIEDNGIGRDAALEAKKLSLKSYTSHGTKIVQEKIALLNTRQDDHYSVKTIDLIDHAGRPAGTKVVLNISIPD